MTYRVTITFARSPISVKSTIEASHSMEAERKAEKGLRIMFGPSELKSMGKPTIRCRMVSD